MAANWERRSILYDVCEGSDFRRGVYKREFFRRICGKTLFLAIGTGIDIKHLPSSHDIVGMDYSHAMIDRSRARSAQYPGRVRLLQADAGNLPFSDQAFDTVVTSCTMCSVLEPTVVFAELYRVLKTDGRLLMFEHVRSKNIVLGLILDLMTLVTGRRGTQMNRDTLLRASECGFHILEVEPVFLDIMLAVVTAK